MKTYYINIDWGKGHTETLEKCNGEEAAREALREWASKYATGGAEGFLVWRSTRATKDYYEKKKIRIKARLLKETESFDFIALVENVTYEFVEKVDKELTEELNFDRKLWSY